MAWRQLLSQQLSLNNKHGLVFVVVFCPNECGTVAAQKNEVLRNNTTVFRLPASADAEVIFCATEKNVVRRHHNSLITHKEFTKNQ